MYTICVIPGDGIGQEVVPQAVRVLEATGLRFAFLHAEAGWDTFQKIGKSVPEETLQRSDSLHAPQAGLVR
jgi:homoisocitrate dehydrogenase